MKVILTQDSDVLGMAGNIVNVSEGYARNYLIPRAMALVANKQNIKFMGMQKKKIETKRLKEKEDAEKVQEKIQEMVITIAQKAGEEGKLYGSVTNMDIVAQLEKQGVVIDRRKIVLDTPIKALGEFGASIRLHPEVTVSIKVNVIPEE